MKYPNAKLYFAGAGDLHSTCKDIIRYFKLEKNIILLGVISSAELLELYEHALGFIQHSVTAENGDMEGTPVAVLEASAAGIPVVSTFHAGIPDVVIHQETGLLSEEHDVTGMASNIERLLGDTQYAKSLGQYGKKYVGKHFSMKNHISIIDNLL